MLSVFIHSNGTVSIVGQEAFSFLPLIAKELENKGVDLRNAEIETIVNSQRKYIKFDDEKNYQLMDY